MTKPVTPLDHAIANLEAGQHELTDAIKVLKQQQKKKAPGTRAVIENPCDQFDGWLKTLCELI